MPDPFIELTRVDAEPHGIVILDITGVPVMDNASGFSALAASSS